MKKALTLIIVVAVSSAVALPLLGQSAESQSEDDASVSELRRELREVERKAAELRRELSRQALTGSSGFLGGANIVPRIAGTLSLFGQRARLGVNIKMAANADTDSKGAVLERVVEDGPAAEAGLQAGDIVTAWDGESLTGRYPAARSGQSEPATKLADLARELDEGDQVEISYLRDGDERTVTVTARELPPATYFAGSGLSYRPLDLNKDGRGDLYVPDPLRSNQLLPALGIWSNGMWSDIELLKLGPELGEYFGTDHGLLVIDTPADNDFGLEIGDVILSIGDREPRDATHLQRILRSYDGGETINLEIMRRKQSMTLSSEVPESRRSSLQPSWVIRNSDRSI